MLDHSGSGIDIYWIHNDHLGRPLSLTDEAGDVVWKLLNADAFGNAANIDEDPDNNSVDLVFNLRFPGQYLDSETGFHYNYFRDYDPGVGRYIKTDPVGLKAGLNLYGYVFQNPIIYRDLTGLDVWMEGPSGSEPSYHQSVAVGNPNGAYNSYSYGMNGKGLQGEVYQDTSLGGPIEAYKPTTAAQDAALNKKLSGMLGEKGIYGWDDICRSWSQKQFNAAPGVTATAPPRVPVPQNPNAVGPYPSRSTTGGVTSTSGSSSNSSNSGTSR